MYVPFLLKEAGQTDGTVDDRNAWAVDLLPTIAEVIDAEIPWEVDGISALGPPREEGPTSFFLNSSAHPAPSGARCRRPTPGARGRPHWSTRSIVPSPADPRSTTRGGPGGSAPAPSWWAGRSPMPSSGGPRGRHAARSGCRSRPPRGSAARAGPVPRAPRGRRADDAVAISVNGTVTSTTRVLDDGSILFLVDPSLYRTGRNDLRVHHLDLRSLAPPSGRGYRRLPAYGPRGYSSVG